MEWQNMFKAPTQGSAIPLYYLYEMAHATAMPARFLARNTGNYFKSPLNPLAATPIGRGISAWSEVFERMTRRYGKPEFGHTSTIIDGEEIDITEQVVWQKPFCSLIHFQRNVSPQRKADPKLLIVAPMSGHYATLLRDTVLPMLPHYDVYITDWTDAREVPLSAGDFDLNDYIDYLIDIFHHLGRGVHVMAVCQPAVPVLAATTYMEMMGDEAVPSTMTLMGGPIDTRCSPTAVNTLAESKGIAWFKENVIVKVPFPHPGMTRQVYPGFLQLTGFMSMNLDRHIEAHHNLFDHLVEGDGESAEKHRDFYDEYLAVMDLTAEFYLQTVDEVFCKHSLPKGELVHRGVQVDCSAIKNISILTVEGEKDDISGKGQTRAALEVSTNLASDKKEHYEQPKVGHYGVFSGSRYRNEIAPVIQSFIAAHPTPGSEKSSNASAAKAKKNVESGNSAKDDLKQIAGIGPKLEESLNAAGITNFAQIANWTKNDIFKFDDLLSFKGRIEREDWVSQAKNLFKK